MRIKDIQEIIVAEGKRKFDKPAVAAQPATEDRPAMDAVVAVAFHFSWWYSVVLVFGPRKGKKWS